MADGSTERGRDLADAGPEAAPQLRVVGAAVVGATAGWMLVYVAGLPWLRLPTGWPWAAVVLASLVAGALAGRLRAGALAGLLSGVSALASMVWAAVTRGGGGAPSAAWLLLGTAVLATTAGGVGALARRRFHRRVAAPDGAQPDGALCSSGGVWDLRMRWMVAWSGAVALVWGGPRLSDVASAPAPATAASPAPWLREALGPVGVRDVAEVWPGPVLWTLVVSAIWLATRAVAGGAARRSSVGRAEPGVGRLVAPAMATVSSLGWLVADAALVAPWSAVAGTGCGGLHLVVSAGGAVRAFRSPARRFADRFAAARAPAAILCLLVGQLMLGVAQREIPSWRWVHILFGVAVLLPVALHFGVRGWLLGRDPVDRRLPLVVASAMTVQVGLGVLALLTPPSAPFTDWMVVTVHLWVAVALIATVARLSARDRPSRRGAARLRRESPELPPPLATRAPTRESS